MNKDGFFSPSFLLFPIDIYVNPLYNILVNFIFTRQRERRISLSKESFYIVVLSSPLITEL